MAFVQDINARVRSVPPVAIYMVGAVPALWLFAQAAMGWLGADPVKALERGLGLWALKLIVAGLCITPLRRFAGVNLVGWRRAVGVLAFSYLVLHLLSWVVLDMGLLWGQVLADIARRPYVTMGMAGFLMLLPLAATSNNLAVRRLGATRWRKLHRLVYPAALAGAVHYIWLVKAWPVGPFVYLAAILVLLALRVAHRQPVRVLA